MPIKTVCAYREPLAKCAGAGQSGGCDAVWRRLPESFRALRTRMARCHWQMGTTCSFAGTDGFRRNSPAVSWAHIRRLLKLSSKYMVAQVSALGISQSQPMIITQISARIRTNIRCDTPTHHDSAKSGIHRYITSSLGLQRSEGACGLEVDQGSGQSPRLRLWAPEARCC